MKQVASARMRCTKCAHEVARFAGYKWKPSAHYFHFRNFHPDPAKLLVEAEADASGAAYCCQCAWTDAGAELREVGPHDAAGPSWVNF